MDLFAASVCYFLRRRRLVIRAVYTAQKSPDQIRSHPHRIAAAEMTRVYTTEKK
jgi:hypothetical protein